MAESDIQIEDDPLESAGIRLRRTRETAGLSLADIAARTKIAERHLASIEQSRFSALASRTYAVGFARAYARAVGLDEADIAQRVRNELEASENTREAPKVDVFEPGDPTRLPGSRLTWLAALVAVALLVFLFASWRSFFSPAVSLPDLTAEKTGAAPTAAASAPVAPAAASGPVVFTALQPGVWVKFYDAAGTQLFQKEMAQGESYTVPADANGPLLRTARPDALQITIGGQIVPKLSDKQGGLKDVPVSAAALLARAAPAAAVPVPASSAVVSAKPASATTPAAATRPAPAATQAPARPATAPSPAPAARPAAERPAPAPAEPAPQPAPPPAAAAPAPAEPSTVSN